MYDVEEKILEYIKTVRPDISIDLRDHDCIKMRNIFDSIEMIGFIDFVEDVFCISVTDEDILNDDFETLKTSIAIIVRKKSAIPTSHE